MSEPRGVIPTSVRATTVERDSVSGRGPGHYLVALVAAYSERRRRARGRLFRERFGLTADDGQTVLDLGGGSGDHIAAIMPRHEGVTVADLVPRDLALARERHGFATILADDTGRVPVPDRSFDIVFCSSVIEHVTGPKELVLIESDERRFTERALVCQKAFADEIRRLGRHYWVQTPYKYFPIESHTWLPGVVVLLPRVWMLRTLRFFDRFWPKKGYPDWNLLTERELRELFPDAEILRERSCGFTKSLIALR